MATGRIGVTPTLGVRWSKAPTGGTTSLSGLDDNSVSLVYSVGYEQVYRNGVLLSRGNDYTATTGTSITLIDATITGDIIEVFAQQLVPLTDAISKGQFTAKGALLSATAASTPGVLGVGANGTVLTAASGQATGLEWATPSSGGMTLLSTTSLSGATTTISGISGSYNSLFMIFTGVTNATAAGQFRIAPNGTTNLSNAGVFGAEGTGGSDGGYNNSYIRFGDVLSTMSISSADNAGFLWLHNYSSSTSFKPFMGSFTFINNLSTKSTEAIGGAFYSNTAITSLVFSNSGGNLSTGTVLLYGVK